MTRRRSRSHTEMIEEIKAIARQQMAIKGAAALSLGAIARALGLSTPALYRYFSNRDALVTALILDAYGDLSDQAEAAVDGIPDDAPSDRFVAVTQAYRQWALQHPQDYVLIHGALFPGYQAPVEEVAGAAMRLVQLVVAILETARTAGMLQIPTPYLDPPRSIREAVSLIAGGADDDTLPATMLTLAYFTWLQLHGLVWQEIAGHLPSELFEDGELYRLQVNLIGSRLGLLDA